MTTQQQHRPIETVGLPRPVKPDYTSVFLEPAIPPYQDLEGAEFPDEQGSASSNSAR